MPNLYNAAEPGRSLFSFRAVLVKVSEPRRADNRRRIRDKAIASNETRFSWPRDSTETRSIFLAAAADRHTG